MTSRPQIEQLIVPDDTKRTAVRTGISAPKNLEQLTELANHMLRDKNLEVSKVHPFFWSMVETYADRFQKYPFDIVKALFCYLELNNFPEQELRDLINRLEEVYQRQHGKPVQKPVFHKSEAVSPFDDEMSELRESLKYAAMVAEMQQQDDEDEEKTTESEQA